MRRFLLYRRLDRLRHRVRTCQLDGYGVEDRPGGTCVLFFHESVLTTPSFTALQEHFVPDTYQPVWIDDADGCEVLSCHTSPEWQTQDAPIPLHFPSP